MDFLEVEEEGEDDEGGEANDVDVPAWGGGRRRRLEVDRTDWRSFNDDGEGSSCREAAEFKVSKKDGEMADSSFARRKRRRRRLFFEIVRSLRKKTVKLTSYHQDDLSFLLQPSIQRRVLLLVHDPSLQTSTVRVLLERCEAWIEVDRWPGSPRQRTHLRRVGRASVRS